MADAIKATLYSEEQLCALLKDIYGALGDNTSDSRYGPLRDKVKYNLDHYYMTDDAAPPVPADFPGEIAKSARPQWGGINQRHQQGHARFVASHGLIRIIPPTNHAADMEIAERIENACNTGLVQAERDSAIYSLQGGLYDGQNLKGLGILHWRKRKLPGMPKYEYLQDLPQDSELDDDRTRLRKERERTRYEKDGERYRETDKSRLSRHDEMKATHGWPWLIQVVDMMTYAEVEDVAAPGGVKIAMRVREVARIDYEREIEERDGQYLVLDRNGQVISIAPDRPSDRSDDRPDTAWGEKAAIAEVWTAPQGGKPGEWYELIAMAGAKWQLVASATHPHTRVPFAKAPGRVTEDAAPEKKYQAVMVDAFKAKATLDRNVMLLMLMAEQTAFPTTVTEVDKDAPESTDEAGTPIDVGPLAAAKRELPPGRHLVELRRDIGRAWVQVVADQRAEIERQLPSVGIAPVSAPSEPNAMYLRLLQAQEMPGIDALANYQSNAIAIMFNDMIHVNSLSTDEGGFGEAICVKRIVDEEHQGQKRRRQELIKVEPGEWVGMQAEYDIDTLLEQKRITLMQMGLVLKEKGVIDSQQLYEIYMKFGNAVAQAKRVTVQKAADLVMRGVIEQELRAAYGKRYVVSQDGVPIGYGGQQLTPEQALKLKGIEIGGNGNLPGQQRDLPDPSSAAMGAIPLAPLAG